eukprot:CAMPEP_0195102142 /NCGR_PEP_ID=MMETSP0448-20130528/66190_1 /TAXON_ID=66468 /ORGANISM="Heterocapsa triquestra, Strain CCMP 448" /LENGTH=112 /DNA_ID=CAMNT_0040137577 /DNA_START=21 /DNA_END=356 /DNA_ORIENTATION=-
MAALFEDMEAELEAGKKALEAILTVDIHEKAAAVEHNCTWNIDWFPEDMPLEDSAGTALAKEVREIAAGMCYREAPDLPRVATPEPEEVLVFADQEGFIMRVLEKVPEGRIG